MNFTDPSTLLLVSLVVIAAMLLIRTRGQLAHQRQRGASDVRNDGGMQTMPPSPGSLPKELAQWEVELHETARQLSAQLDAKLSLLQSLIAEAEQAAGRLEDAIDRSHPTLPPGSQAESLRPAASQARTAPHDDEAGLSDTDLSSADDGGSRASDRGRRRDEIYSLADYGFAAAEIARRVGSPVGEVELILSLREK